MGTRAHTHTHTPVSTPNQMTALRTAKKTVEQTRTQPSPRGRGGIFWKTPNRLAVFPSHELGGHAARPSRPAAALDRSVPAAPEVPPPGASPLPPPRTARPQQREAGTRDRARRRNFSPVSPPRHRLLLNFCTKGPPTVRCRPKALGPAHAHPVFYRVLPPLRGSVSL